MFEKEKNIINIQETNTVDLIRIKESKIKTNSLMYKITGYIMTCQNYFGISLIIIGFIAFFERQIITANMLRIMFFYLVILIINQVLFKVSEHNLKICDEITNELNSRKQK